MGFKNTVGLAAIACSVLPAANAVAQEAPRFDSRGVLDTIDVFSDQRAHLKNEGHPDTSLAPGLTVDFSFRGAPAEREPGFLYFHEGDDPVAETDSAAAPSVFTPRLSALDGLDRTFAPEGRVRPAVGFTPRYAGAEVTLSLTPSREAAAAGRSFDLTLSSEFMVQETQAFGSRGDFDFLTPFERRSSNIGMSLGYMGFRFGAALMRETGGLEPGIEGFDLGLGYEWSAFSTEITVGEYSRLEGLLDRAADLRPVFDKDFYKLELGAAYELSTRVRFSGGIRFYDYGARFGFEGEGSSRAGVLYLGTRLNF